MSDTVVLTVRLLVEDLRASIFGRWEPGSLLLVEALADKLGAEPRTVADALEQLTREGLTTREESRSRYRVVAAQDPHGSVTRLNEILALAINSRRIFEARDALNRLEPAPTGGEPPELLAMLVADVWIAIAATLGPDAVREANACLLSAFAPLDEAGLRPLSGVLHAMSALVMGVDAGGELGAPERRIAATLQRVCRPRRAHTPAPPTYRSAAGLVATSEQGWLVVRRADAEELARFTLSWTDEDRLTAIDPSDRRLEIVSKTPGAALAVLVAVVEAERLEDLPVPAVERFDEGVVRITVPGLPIVVVDATLADAGFSATLRPPGQPRAAVTLHGTLSYGVALKVITAWALYLERDIDDRLANLEHLLGRLRDFISRQDLDGRQPLALVSVANRFNTTVEIARQALTALVRSDELYGTRNEGRFHPVDGAPPSADWQIALRALRLELRELAERERIPAIQELARRIHGRIRKRFSAREIRVARRALVRTGELVEITADDHRVKRDG